MRLIVKICGLSTERDVAAAVAGGADAVGFVFAESPRRVTPAQARVLASVIPPDIKRVAVMCHPTSRDVAAVLDGFEPDWFQTDAVDFESIELPGSVKAVPVYRDVPGFVVEEVEEAGPIVFEGAASGVGQAVDRAVAARVADRTRVILAGGLDPGNVGEAIAQVEPWGVDVSSGVERAPGKKDPDLINAFIEAVRFVEKQYENRDSA